MTRRGGRNRGPARGHGHHHEEQRTWQHQHHQNQRQSQPQSQPKPVAQAPAQQPRPLHIGYFQILPSEPERPTQPPPSPPPPPPSLSKREQRQKAREVKRRVKNEELSRLDREIWEAKLDGNEFEWCSLMGQRMMVEENYTDTDEDDYEDDDDADDQKPTPHACNCEHCPVKKAATSTGGTIAQQVKQRARRAEIARINRDMMSAKARGDDFDYYAQMGLRMYMDEQESDEEEQDEDDEEEEKQRKGFSGYAVAMPAPWASRPTPQSSQRPARTIVHRTGLAIERPPQQVHQCVSVFPSSSSVNLNGGGNNSIPQPPTARSSSMNQRGRPQQINNSGRGGGRSGGRGRVGGRGHGGGGRGGGRGQRSQNRSRSRSRDRNSSQRAYTPY